MTALRKSLKVPFGLPAPSWAVKFAAPTLMKTDADLALYGRFCEPKRLIKSGFEFKHPDLAGALKAIFLR
jgi:NAD dependent epimerase/dehydratase family enzyme